MEVLSEPDERILTITRLSDPPGLRLEGELDATRHEDVTAALSSLVTEASEVRLDLAGLRFIDLGALSMLAGFVERQEKDVRIVLDNMSPSVEQLIELLSWERLPGLVRGQKGDSR